MGRKQGRKAAPAPEAKATHERLAVTNENFGELLLASVAEAVEIHEGRATPARVHSYPQMTSRDVEVEPVEHFDAARVRALREHLGVSQDVFARLCNVSLFTDRSWEQGHRVPDGAAVRLLQLFEQDDRLARRLIRRLNRTAEAQRRPGRRARAD